MTKVSLTRCSDYNAQNVNACLLRHFELLGGLERFISRGERVLIKPNMIAPKPAECATQTNPVVIIELAKILLDFGARPFVGDSPAWADAAACAAVLGIVEPLKKLGVEIKQLDKPVKRTLEHCGTKIGISSVALDADKIINLPKLKTHQQLGATIAVKNMFGIVSGKAKAIWHYRKGKTFDGFCTMLLDIYRLANPVLTIVDGIVAMEGPGPINGEPKKFGWLIGGVDPIAVELVYCDLMGFSPEDLPIIQTAKKIGFGCADKKDIQIIGDLPGDAGGAGGKFVPAGQTPLVFSPARIVKSILRQIFILVKSRQNH
ncbi:MAG: DUF362 domain-containing protein [Sedimentisphaerales bacterium]